MHIFAWTKDKRLVDWTSQGGVCVAAIIELAGAIDIEARAAVLADHDERDILEFLNMSLAEASVRTSAEINGMLWKQKRYYVSEQDNEEFSTITLRGPEFAREFNQWLSGADERAIIPSHVQDS